MSKTHPNSTGRRMGEINGWGADPPVKEAVEVVGTLVISETRKVFDATNRTKTRVFDRAQCRSCCICDIGSMVWFAIGRAIATRSASRRKGCRGAGELSRCTLNG